MEYEEISRVRSPDGKVDAVLMRGNAGAMSSFTYCLYVVPFGCEISEKDIRKNKYKVVLDGSRMDGEKIVWLKTGVLEIQYREAEIYQFVDRISPLSEDKHYEVEIKKTLLADTPAGTPSSSDRWLKNYIYSDQNSRK